MRLPALGLEALVFNLINRHLSVPIVQTHIVVDASVEDIASVKGRLTDVFNNKSNSKNELDKATFGLVERIRIAPGQIDISLSDVEIADLLGVEAERISVEHLSIGSEFQYKNVVLKRNAFLLVRQANVTKFYSRILQRHMATLT